MCTGRIDPTLVFRGFANGADGIIIVGCRLNECNYTTHGNYAALNKTHLCRQIMKYVGIDPARLRIEFMSSGEGILFADTMNDFVQSIRKLGPLGRVEGLEVTELKSKAKQVVHLVPYIKLAMRDKLAVRPATLDEYEQLYTPGDIEKLFHGMASYHIDPERCRACMICLRRCPVEAISGGKGQKHVIDQTKCIHCGTCFEICPSRFGAVVRQPAAAQSYPSAR
jgi:F420-non-reducing hydrogenase iron-sulfur subunit